MAADDLATQGALRVLRLLCSVKRIDLNQDEDTYLDKNM